MLPGMSPTAFDDPPFERVAPTWEVGRPSPPASTPTPPRARLVRVAVVAAAALAALIAAAVVVVALAGFALGLPMGAGVGKRTPHPLSAAALADGFELGAGTLRLDLRDVTFPRGTTRTNVEVAFGRATVIVPRDVEVVIDGRVVAGQATTFGRAEDGVGVDTSQTTGAGPRAPRLVIDARVGFGQLVVQRA